MHILRLEGSATLPRCPAAGASVKAPRKGLLVLEGRSACEGGVWKFFLRFLWKFLYRSCSRSLVALRDLLRGSPEHDALQYL